MKASRFLKQCAQKISAILAVAIFLAGTNTSAYADSRPTDALNGQRSEAVSETSVQNANEFKFYTDYIDQQLYAIKTNPNYSVAYKEAAEEKAELIKALLSGESVAQPRRSSCSNYVPFYPQETDFYCGPASIQQTMGHYDYIPMPSQSSIYSDTLNSEWSEMISYLNEKLNPDNEPGYICYGEWWNHSSKNMKTTITSIAGAGTPIIAHISVGQAGRTSYTDTRHWPYTTDGHYLSISGYQNSGNQIEVTDPFILETNVGQSDSRYNGGKYEIDFDVLNTTCDRLIL